MNDASVSFEGLDRFLLIRLSGDLMDTECASVMDRITEELRDTPRDVILDVTAVSDVGSLLIGGLVKLGQACRERRHTMSVVAREGKALLVFELLGLTSMFEHHTTVADAVLAGGGERDQLGRDA